MGQRHHAFARIVVVFLSAIAPCKISAESLPSPPGRAYARDQVVSKMGIAATTHLSRCEDWKHLGIERQRMGSTETYH